MPCPDCIPTFAALPKLRECKIMSRLRSNQFPVAFERDQITEVLSDAQRELVEYDTTIARLHEMIVSLENEKRSLNRQVDLAKSLMAPIRKLPPDILRRIFIEHGATNIIRATGSKVPGLKMVTVCSHWRCIALDTTALWNTISVKIRQGECHWSSYQQLLIESLLRLSAKSQLSISINSDKTIAAIPPFLPLLCEQADRWQSLSGYCFSDTILDALSTAQGHLNSLHTFTLVCPFVRCSTLLKDVPKLHTLTASRMSKTEHASIPWNQIVELGVRHSRTSDILRSLAVSPELKTLTVVYLSCVNNLNVPKHERLVHSNLSVLDISIGDNDDAMKMTKLFHLLDLPNLKSLSITSTSEDQSWQYKNTSHWSNKDLPSFVSRASAITSFHLESVWISTNGLIALLQRMPALSSFSMSDPDFDDSDKSMLNDDFLLSISGHSRQDHQPLLTHLTSLSLEGFSLDSFSMRNFIGVVHSRWNPSSLIEDEVACIRTVKLRIREDSIDPAVVHPLAILEKRGLDVVIKDKDGDVLAPSQIRD